MQKKALLLFSVFVVAVCGLVYELLAGTLSSYLLGDSVTHFSLVIGVFLSSMGLGAWLSKFVRQELLRAFVAVEIWVGLVGGLSALALFAAFAYTTTYLPALFGLGGLIGCLIGFEIPLLIRILAEEGVLRVTVSDVLAADYVGALAASLLFPTLLVPHLGMMKTSFLFGLMNVAVAYATLRVFKDRIPRRKPLTALCIASSLLLGTGFVSSEWTSRRLEAARYEDDVIYSRQTRYQKIVLTRWRDDVRLFLDGNLQFCSVDEHRYHESLVHPAMSLAKPERILVLGGGDGMVLREALKYASLREALLVDLDPGMTRLFSSNPMLTRLNGDSLLDPRVRVVNQDAMAYLQDDEGFYDAVFMDLPDPNSLSLGKLYTTAFFRLAARRLSRNGILVTQASSPFYSREAFWCVVNTVKEAMPGADVKPYHALVPSFGEWGFVMASRSPMPVARMEFKVPLRFLNTETARAMFVFPEDLGPLPSPVNRLDDQALVRLYEKGWEKWNY
ncbi:MAG: polyamine aminopropyltransferase [Elusimicrobiota bacterium]